MQKLKEYQGFVLDLMELSKVFTLIGRSAMNNTDLLEETGYGTNKIRGIKEYMSDLKLFESKNTLTDIGQLILQKDHRFRDPFTKWILLFHWSIKENNPFLHFLVNDFSQSSDDVAIMKKFMQWAERNNVKTDYEGKKLNGLINKTKSALLESFAFHSLNVFSYFNGQLERAEPYNVHPYLIAYIMYFNRNGRSNISFNELLNERNNVAKFFNWNTKELELHMVELMNLKLIKMVHHADLNQIDFVYNGTTLNLIERYYDEY